MKRLRACTWSPHSPTDIVHWLPGRRERKGGCMGEGLQNTPWKNGSKLWVESKSFFFNPSQVASAAYVRLSRKLWVPIPGFKCLTLKNLSLNPLVWANIELPGLSFSLFSLTGSMSSTDRKLADTTVSSPRWERLYWPKLVCGDDGEHGFSLFWQNLSCITS